MRIGVLHFDRILKMLPLYIIMALLLLGVAPLVYADNQLPDRYVKISASEISSGSQHEIGFTITELSIPVGSISIEYCSNSPLIGDPCTQPNGFDATNVVLFSSQGEPNFSIDPSSTTNKILLTRPASLPTGNPFKYVFSNIINPNAVGSYFVRIQTFTSTDGSGLPIQYGGMVFAITSPLSVTTEVPPYLTFCVGVTIVGVDCSSINSYFIDVGELSTQTTKAASSEFVVATNAQNGYSITLSGATLTSGSNVIPALNPGSSSVTGTSQFGINLRSNSNPNIGNDPIGYPAGSITAAYSVPNQFRFQAGDTLVTSTTTSDNQKFTVSYITNISSNQAAGIYAATLTYIALANF